jgi:hypothetical protein
MFEGALFLKVCLNVCFIIYFVCSSIYLVDKRCIRKNYLSLGGFHKFSDNRFAVLLLNICLRKILFTQLFTLVGGIIIIV